MNRLTNAEQFFEGAELEQRDVDIALKQGTVTVTVKGMTAAERDRFEAKVARGSNKKNTNPLATKGLFRATLVAKCVINQETGRRIFSDDEQSLQRIAKMPSRAVNKLFNVAAELSGISEEDEDELLGSMGKTATSDESGELQPSEEKPEAN